MISYTDTKARYGAENTLPIVVLEEDGMHAVIALQGAQILEFRAKGQDFLWLSPNAIFEEGRSVRGGIPICAPWFGIHPDPSRPKHGFVRSKLWSLEAAQERVDGSVRLVFSYDHASDGMFPHKFRMVYKMTFSDSLTLKLSVENTGSVAMPFGWAFHSYYPVADLKTVRVTGLDGIEYLDATQKFKKIRQEGPVMFEGEVDRVYEGVPEAQMIEGVPMLSIEGDGCPTAIVWNSGPELAAKMADIGEDGYTGYICVERGAAFADTWKIEAGKSRTATMQISNKTG